MFHTRAKLQLLLQQEVGMILIESQTIIFWNSNSFFAREFIVCTENVVLPLMYVK